MRCEYCGLLDWTFEHYGAVVHKEACPFRVTSYHQGNPPIKTNKTTMEKTMTRDQVFNVVSGERDFQDKLVADPSRPDMIEDFHIGDGLTAIEYNLRKAQDAWYVDAVPHTEAMKYLRKVAGIIVQLGERYGMPEREK